MAQPFKHEDVSNKTDDALRDEARAHFVRSPNLQIATEVLDRLRKAGVPWWSPKRLRGAFPCIERMRWLADRPDLRQSITHDLTGFASKTARSLTIEGQAELIDAVIDCGDVTCEAFEAAFDPRDLVTYGPVATLWREFRENMPWDVQTRAHQELMASLIRIVLADRSEDGLPRMPLLSPVDVRMAIGGATWHRCLPLEVRVAIDEARLTREKVSAREPFLVRDELDIVTPEVMTTYIPLRELQRIVIVAEKVLGFEPLVPDVSLLGEQLAGSTMPPPQRDSAVLSRPVVSTPSRVARQSIPTPWVDETELFDVGT